MFVLKKHILHTGLTSLGIASFEYGLQYLYAGTLDKGPHYLGLTQKFVGLFRNQNS